MVRIRVGCGAMLSALVLIACAPIDGEPGSPTGRHSAGALAPLARAMTPRGPARPRRAEPSPRRTRIPLAAGATSGLTWVTCPDEAQGLGGACGELVVPLDRSRPGIGSIAIYFERYLHTSAGPAESAILANEGGPGDSTTGLRSLWLSAFAPNLGTHDLLLIDDRGRGSSATIDCEPLQHGEGTSFEQEIADCATQLGAAAGAYATADIALDADAVREALGYDRVDYYGGSYGGVDAIAYATRFGAYVRSLILDSPQGPAGLVPFAPEKYQAPATVREIDLECRRSPLCSADHADPTLEFDRLVKTLRAHPLLGTGHDVNGNPLPVTFDESLLLTVSVFGGSPAAGELLAASSAFAKGDPAPLLRLGGEAGGGSSIADAGPPTNFSYGALVATACADLQAPYDWSASPAQRLVAFERAAAALPDELFAPFSHAAATSEAVSNGRACTDWQRPTPPLPVVPPCAEYPRVPVIVFASDVDPVIPLELARHTASSFPGSHFISVAEAPHEPALSEPCPLSIANHFLDTLDPGDTSCARTPGTILPAVGRFPRLAKEARAAEVDPTAINEVAEPERKVASVAVATAVDALKRSLIGGIPGVGLRGGTTQTSFPAAGGQVTTLTGCAFAEDVIVDGSVTWGADQSFDAQLIVSGAGTAGGTLRVTGTWEAAGAAGVFRVGGMLGGTRVGLRVPNA